MKTILMTRLIALALSAFALVACTGGANTAGETPTPTVEIRAELRPVQETLTAAQALWAAQEAQDYTYTLRIGCFCRPELTMPVVVEVRDGKPQPVRYADGGTPPDLAWFEPYDTAEELFAFVQNAIDRDAASITAEYDTRMGVPTRVAVDYSTEIADEERAIEVTGFGITK